MSKRDHGNTTTEGTQRDATERLEDIREWVRGHPLPDHGRFVPIESLLTDDLRLLLSLLDAVPETPPVEEERPYPPIAPEKRPPGCWVHDTTQPDCDMCASVQYPDGPRGILQYRADLLDYLRTDPKMSAALRDELARTASAIRHALD